VRNGTPLNFLHSAKEEKHYEKRIDKGFLVDMRRRPTVKEHRGHKGRL
jgi:hypothetical protein